ncbi:MAG: CHASE2 domain-containing protein [Gemmatimonadaceae bacterium]|nr:CHASE2 domain-containing protein [Gemmatimonadaceae bacterium]
MTTSHDSASAGAGWRARLTSLRWTNIVACAGLVVLSGTSKGIPILEPWSNAALDAAVRRATPAETGRVAVVLIRARSRVDAQFGYPTRAERLFELVRAVDSAGPEVIGVDILTHDPGQYRSYNDPATSAPTVWVWIADTRDTLLMPLAPIGGKGLLHGELGLSHTVRESDGVLRRYTPYERAGNETYASFARAIVRTGCAERARSGTTDEDRRRCRFALPDSTADLVAVGTAVHDSMAIDAWSLLLAFSNRATDPAAWDSISKRLRGHIVLIGGADSDDVHATASGTSAGVLLQSQLVTAELGRSFFRLPRPWVSYALKFLLAGVIMLLYAVVSPGSAMLGVCAIAAATFWYAGLPRANGGYWVNVVPLLVGVVLELLLESHFGHAINHWLQRIGSAVTGR